MIFQGTSRFQLVEKLGEGGMGVVYEAFDREREMRVALKTLRKLDASSLYRFKREFRSLSDISHTNIVGLYELVSERDQWFFTMELVEGEDLVTYVRPHARANVTDAASLESFLPSNCATEDDTRVCADSLPGTVSDETTDADSTVSERPRPYRFADLVDNRKLRHVLVQLARALDALHRAGMVHRDLKPSNVRVTPEGRVVLMDFGIVAETLTASEESSERRLIGTPAYMAPEQAAGEPATAAADWYSLGVVLYVMLTGTLPFSGPRDTIMLAKQARGAPPAGLLVRDIPADLACLCNDLLERRPGDRPRGHEVLARLGVPLENGGGGVDLTTLTGMQTFVGRESELRSLHRAYDTMRDGETVSVFCVGVSGMGKSTLVRRFLHEVEARGGAGDAAIVLRGRCHERESLPYKALDTVIDNLTRVLLGLSGARVALLLPDEVDLLTRLFPVLRRVPGIQTAHPLGGLDPQDLRVRAFSALREMLRRVAAWRPLILYIDDLQWADRDSLDLLLELLREPSAPEFLLLASVRSEDIDNPASRSEDVVRAMDEIAKNHRCERLVVGPLSEGEQTQLVEKLLGVSPVVRAFSHELWADSRGSPFFLGELVRYLQDEEDSLESLPPTLDNVIWRRIRKLPSAARRLLEVVSVVGEPAAISTLADSIDMNAVECERAAAVLRVSNMARVARHGKDPWLTAYHDRVRETVCAHLSEEDTRTLHQHIAQALERGENASVDALARHWLAAGDAHQARGYMVSAAEVAEAKLAFGRAADLYSAAMMLGGLSEEDRRPLRCKMAAALATAGRSYEAARVYQQAAEEAEAEDDVAELTRLAADNLLRSGRIVEGLDALGAVMNDLGITVKPTRNRALLSLVMQRARIAVRGYKYRRRAEADVAVRDLGRLDTLYAASTSLGMIDHIRGADLQTRHLVSALKYGEERRVCRALAVEAVFRASFGGRNARVATRLSKDAEVIARRMGEPYLVAVSQLALGATAFFEAKPATGAVAFAEAERLLQTECVGADWERITARYFRCQCLVQTGDLADVARSVERILEEADRRSDVYARNLFKTQPSMWRWLIVDDPERALLELSDALDGWPEDRYYVAHHFVMIARAIAMLYQRRYDEVRDHLRQGLADARRAMIAKVPWGMAEVYALMARSAVEIGDLATVKEAVRFMDGMGFSVLAGISAGLRGAIAARSGDQAEAQRLLVDAVRLCEESRFGLYHAGYRYRLGEMTPGAEGERVRREVVDWLSSKGVENPMGIVDYHAPSYLSAVR